MFPLLVMNDSYQTLVNAILSTLPDADALAIRCCTPPDAGGLVAQPPNTARHCWICRSALNHRTRRTQTIHGTNHDEQEDRSSASLADNRNDQVNNLFHRMVAGERTAVALCDHTDGEHDVTRRSAETYCETYACNEIGFVEPHLVEEIDAQLERVHASTMSGYVNVKKHDRTPCPWPRSAPGQALNQTHDQITSLHLALQPMLQRGIVAKLVPGTLRKPRLATRVHVPELHFKCNGVCLGPAGVTKGWGGMLRMRTGSNEGRDLVVTWQGLAVAFVAWLCYEGSATLSSRHTG